MRLRGIHIPTWRLEATAQAALYAGTILAQFGTLWRPELVLAGVMWLLGRVASRADRQREEWEAAGVAKAMQAHHVKCAAGTVWDLRLVTIGFGAWGLIIGSWLTLADVLWGILYPFWRRWYRARFPRSPERKNP